jgi:hypothetical protein
VPVSSERGAQPAIAREKFFKSWAGRIELGRIVPE